jgi:hypothetical protein
MVRISSNYAAMQEAQNVRLAAYGEIAWVRVEQRDSVNLLFSSRKDSGVLPG